MEPKIPIVKHGSLSELASVKRKLFPVLLEGLFSFCRSKLCVQWIMGTAVVFILQRLLLNVLKFLGLERTEQRVNKKEKWLSTEKK